MRKTIAAVTAGLLLVAGQAAAANGAADARVVDRVGARAGASSEFRGIPAIPMIVLVGSIIAWYVVSEDDASESA